MPERNQNAETTLGLHLPGQNLHRRVEDDALEGHRRWEHGHGVQEVFEGKFFQIFACKKLILSLIVISKHKFIFNLKLFDGTFWEV